MVNSNIDCLNLRIRQDKALAYGDQSKVIHPKSPIARRLSSSFMISPIIDTDSPIGEVDKDDLKAVVVVAAGMDSRIEEPEGADD